MPKRERDIESATRDAIKANGGRMKKWVSPGWRGCPDDIVFWPGGVRDIVEFKKPGEVITAEQRRAHRELGALGTPVLIIDSMEKAIAYVRSRAS